MAISPLAPQSMPPFYHTDPAPIAMDMAVVFRGDGEPKVAHKLIAQLAEFERRVGIQLDNFARGGTVETLEQRFAALLGKDAAVFMPTGTLANHLAIRQLCGSKPRALVQEQSHLYQDTGDCVPQLSGITLVPLAPGQPYFSLEELQEAFQGSHLDRVARPVGAVMIESPVRRQYGQIVPYDTLVALTNFCQSQGIATHLDGARLYMMAAATGISPRQYASHFDTVYVSLYKYFGAPFGAILAGPAALLHDLYHTRRMFGGGLASASLAAALALQGMEQFEERFAAAMAQGMALITQLNACQGLHIRPFPYGSNIFPVILDASIHQETFLAVLRQHQIFLYPDDAHPDQYYLTVNTTILRQPNTVIFQAFQEALYHASHENTIHGPKTKIS